MLRYDALARNARVLRSLTGFDRIDRTPLKRYAA